MLKNVFKLNGKPIDVANTWDDLTYSQFWRVMNNTAGDTSELISVITNVPRETLLKGNMVGFEAILGILDSLIKQGMPEWGEQYVSAIGPYKLPKNKDGKFNIQFESLGQFEDMRQIMSTITDSKGLTAAHPHFVAIYLQKIRDGEYNPEQAKEMVEEIKGYPAKEVMTLGSFFYGRLKDLLSGTPPSSPTTKPSPRKKKPVSRGSIKSSGSTRR